MTEEILEKATDLYYDIKTIDKLLKERLEDRHWIAVVCPNHKEEPHSYRFMNDIVAFLKEKREQYQKEFDNLKV